MPCDVSAKEVWCLASMLLREFSLLGKKSVSILLLILFDGSFEGSGDLRLTKGGETHLEAVWFVSKAELPTTSTLGGVHSQFAVQKCAP